MAMSHAWLRDLAFTGDAASIEKYARQIIEKDPSRAYAHDVLEIAAALVRGDYITAEALIEVTKHRYADSPMEVKINQPCLLFSTFIDFAFGRFKNVRTAAHEILARDVKESGIEVNDRIALFKLLADTAFLLDDYVELESIWEKANQLRKEGDSDQTHYFLNMIEALVLFERGDFRQAYAVSERAIVIAKRKSFTGIASDLTAQNIRYRSLICMAQFDQAEECVSRIIDQAYSEHNWPWFFVTQGSLIKRRAQENKIKESLAGVRELSSQISNFTFKNELTLFVDAAELYVRYLLNDIERINVLMGRLPELLIVKQIKTSFDTSSKNKSGLQAIDALPENNSREALFKLVSFTEFYANQESKAVPYARKALALAEETGYVQFLLLQNDLYDIFLKASKIAPTTFTEEFARRLTEHIKEQDQQNRGGLMEPLTNRELEVLQHLATGKPISQIGSSLHVSMNTMKTHLRNTYRKLEVDGRESAVKKAQELHII